MRYSGLTRRVAIGICWKKVPISKLSDESGLQPTVFYCWQKEFFENGAARFVLKGKSCGQMVQRFVAFGVASPFDSAWRDWQRTCALQGGLLMNVTAKFVASIGLLGFLCLMLPGSGRADTIYTYTGNPYTVCSGTYVCNGVTPFLSITFDTTLTGAQLDNLTAGGNAASGNLTASVISFTFTDHVGVTLDQTNYTPDSLVIQLSTNGLGIPTEWRLEVDSTNDEAGSCTTGVDDDACSVPAGQEDQSVLADPSGGSLLLTAGQLGQWTVTTPEPSSFLLLGSGLLCVAALVLRSKRQSTSKQTT
jgi:hypothetical protein